MMADIVNLPLRYLEVDAEVAEFIEQLRGFVENKSISGLAVGVTFRDGRSLTKATKSEDRRVMLALLLDMLLDYQKNAG